MWTRQSCLSPSSRRAWIEIILREFIGRGVSVALLAEGVDRNSFAPSKSPFFSSSPSSRRAWIEMMTQHHSIKTPEVALLAEGVDRNHDYFTSALPSPVALLAEGVDRNCVLCWHMVIVIRSPSSRRAWIEISICFFWTARAAVALLAEGVDRNLLIRWRTPTWAWSPSSRRAWIEIIRRRLAARMRAVALLAEGVDRNNYDYGVGFDDACRPPRGGRG